MRINAAQLKASLYRKSYKDFVKGFWPVLTQEPLEWNWHMDVMCDQVQSMYERLFRGEPRDGDSVTNVSPGSSKSTVYSIMPVPWAWTIMPNLQFIGASYSHHIALDLSRKSRDIIKSDLYRSLFPEVQLRSDMDMKGHFSNTAGGSRYAVGSRGSVTGMHGHVICVDDPLNPEQAASAAELHMVNEWIKVTLSNRKVSKRRSFMQLVMQRLGVEDPTELFIKRPRVHRLCLPASLEYPVYPPELADYYVDGLMDPNRLPREFLDEEKLTGEYYYAGQYGQAPIPAGGGMFKTELLRWGVQPDRFVRLVRFWDRAATPEGAKGSRRSSFTVGVLMGIDEHKRIWVLDVVRVKMDTFSREALIRRTAIRDGKSVIVGLEQEPGSGGKDSVTATARRLAGWRVKILRAGASKEVRADAFSVAVNGVNVYIPARFRTADGWDGWARDYVDELKYWPLGKYKDQGDASGGAYSLLMTGTVRVGPLRKRSEDRRREIIKRIAAVSHDRLRRRSSRRFVSLAV